MKATYSTKAQRGGDLALLEQATSCLKDVLGTSADRIEVEWDQTQDDRGRSVYTLTLSDSKRRVEAQFSREELNFASYMRARLYRLWGDLLQLISDEAHRKVLELVAQMGED